MAISAKLVCIMILAMAGHTAANTVVDVAVNDADQRFTVLATALTDRNLVETLSGAGPFTVFAPTNSAFEALGLTEQQLLARADLTAILTYHVLGAEVMSSALTNGQRAATLEGTQITVSVEGSTVMIDDATVTTADVNADNGVVHIIDKVLMPRNTVVDVAASDSGDRFTVLYTALAQQGLLPTLSGAGPFTVFAPTNPAFEALGLTQEELLARADLTDILTYHVLGAEVMSSALTNGQTAETLEGRAITVSIEGSTVMIDDATVTTADVNADNGVVHIIDTVLIPPTSSSTSVDASSARAPRALAGLLLACVSAVMA